MISQIERYQTDYKLIKLYAEFYLRECEDAAELCAKRVDEAFNSFKKITENDNIISL